MGKFTTRRTIKLILILNSVKQSSAFPQTSLRWSRVETAVKLSNSSSRKRFGSCVYVNSPATLLGTPTSYLRLWPLTPRAALRTGSCFHLLHWLVGASSTVADWPLWSHSQPKSNVPGPAVCWIAALKSSGWGVWFCAASKSASESSKRIIVFEVVLKRWH